MKEKDFLIKYSPGVLSILISSVILLIAQIQNSTGTNAIGMYYIPIVLIYPLSFLIQGILCAVNNTNKLFSLIASTVMFLLFCIIAFGPTGLGYIIAYIIFFFIGYGITCLIKVIASKSSSK